MPNAIHLRRRLTWGVLLTTLGALAATLFVTFTKPGCDALDFKWAPREGRCVTPLCAYGAADCGSWANPVTRCDRVHPGQSLRRLRYELGEPESLENDVAEYIAAKAGRDRIRVTLRGDVVERIDCPSTP